MASLLTANNAVIKASRIETAARDYVAQRTAKRFAIRNLALWAKPADFLATGKAVAAMQADIETLQQDLADSPGQLQTVHEIAALGKTINSRDSIEIDAVRRDRALALKAFLQTNVNGVSPAVYQALRDNAVDVPRESKLSKLLVSNSAARTGAVEANVSLSFRSAVIVLAVALAAALALSIFVAAGLARRITRRLDRVRRELNQVVVSDVSDLTGAFRDMARGDLTAAFASERPALRDEGHDEIRDLAETYNALALALNQVSGEFSTTTDRLSGVIRNVQETSLDLASASLQMSAATVQSGSAVREIAQGMDGVAEGARLQSKQLAQASLALEEVSVSATQISGGASYQADSVHAAAGAVAQMNEQISGLAHISDSLAAAAREATAQAEAGTAEVGSTAHAMHALRAYVDHAREAMVALEERSASVSEIVRTINEIADQTNLLALNAAIEAARAGEHGRGFAVVAVEIRKLAERASISTKEITGILGGVRADTERVSQAMQSSSDSMADGIQRAERAASALQVVETTIATAKEAAEEMAVRAEQMRLSSARVMENLESVSSIVGENAAATNQMTASMESITGVMSPVADSAIEQSAAADEVSSSAADLSAQIQQLASTATRLQDQADTMRSLAGTFRVSDALVPAPFQPALSG